MVAVKFIESPGLVPYSRISVRKNKKSRKVI